ncbi:hypothetical protein [Fibrobacter sp. UWH4]|uniref:hypothetical protein n=1 Tax=Fibrobacter sp. UWH4 TaxID=1896210 RepID=UPI0009239FB1|nr:hypothetical protein [Fibrobacter sp. UWH4]SHL03350.1 hypothetical protein SAMN05720762_10421 [Fibrobacter sp. UWH4]
MTSRFVFTVWQEMKSGRIYCGKFGSDTEAMTAKARLERENPNHKYAIYAKEV